MKYLILLYFVSLRKGRERVDDFLAIGDIDADTRETNVELIFGIVG